jgi:hypothetical protein
MRSATWQFPTEACKPILKEASGIRAFRDSLRKHQYLVREEVMRAGQGRPLGAGILALPWGWMLASG